MEQQALSDLHHGSLPDTALSLTTSYLSPTHTTPAVAADISEQNLTPKMPVMGDSLRWSTPHNAGSPAGAMYSRELGSTGKGILIGMLSAFGSAALVGIIIAIIYFFRYTSRGRILLDRISRPGEFDDEQAFLRDEEEALSEMDELQRTEYLRAKAFVQANPPESVPTDISLSQFLAIQEKGVSAWEFEPELEIANCFVEARTEIEFFDSECSVQSNLPIPKQNEVYYWEAKVYEKPETSLVSIGFTTKPYPLFRMPGFHRQSVAYLSSGYRRYNQPFTPVPYGPPILQGDVIGVGYRPRTGTIFFTRNGKKLEDVAHGLKSQNFFPTVGANGPCNIHVNFGQMGFVFIEANVKKWGLAPMTGSLAPPPPYGSEQGSILLECGREGAWEGQPQGLGHVAGHFRSTSAQLRLARGPSTTSPGPQRSPTDISLAQLNLVDFDEGDAGEGTSGAAATNFHHRDEQEVVHPGLPFEPSEHPPPDYESPVEERDDPTPISRRSGDGTEESRALLPRKTSPPIPTYEAATGERRGRANTRDRDGR